MKERKETGKRDAELNEEELKQVCGGESVCDDLTPEEIAALRQFGDDCKSTSQNIR